MDDETDPKYLKMKNFYHLATEEDCVIRLKAPELLLKELECILSTTVSVGASGLEE